ncbi:hypothetical protein IWT25_00753 [Secundilactobacillus pentosiphilus]|uniref:ADP ribosyltransferase domain-containing protein n=1 Tax=Secundilactobacillus pentosiphilus TaxID=1714682 RepID=A0A1Z5IUM9_9LACO|nr:hypothetical protein IWT25_00753 [Secundilactobacillus pentosiphilus]
MQLFCNRYAKDNQLTPSEVAQRITHWDKQQWLNAIRQLDTHDWPEEAQKRLTGLAKDAGINVHHMMNAIVGAGVLAYFVHEHNLVQRRVKVDGATEIARAQVKPRQANRLVSIVTDPENATKWSTNLWEDSDQFTRDLQSVVSKHIRHGTSIDDLVNTLIPHSKALEKPGTNAADRLAVAKRNADRLITTESARVKDRVNMATYRMQGVKYVRWVTEPGACEKCQGIADGGPYLTDDCPSIPDDSHPNCRCSKIPAGYEYLSADQLRALNEYKSSSSYLINEALATGQNLTSEMKAKVDAIDDALKMLPHYSGEIYRSIDTTMLRTSPINFRQQYLPGNVRKEKAYSSFSTDIYNPSAKIQMHVQAAHSPRDFRSVNSAEHEILYERNSKFWVTGSTMDSKGRLLLQMEEYHGK